MSITLSTMPICEDCGEFEPDTNVMEVTSIGDPCSRYNTEVFCVHADRCRRIVKRSAALAKEDNL